MIYTSLAVLALSASAVMNPITHLVHMHPRPAQADNRVSVVLYNNGNSFQDVKVDGHFYTVNAHHTLEVKAPAGTVVYAASRTFSHRRGDAILEVTPKVENQRIDIK
jgi:hypothetical protein